MCASNVIFCFVHGFNKAVFVDAWVEVLKFMVRSPNTSTWLPAEILKGYTNLKCLSISHNQIVGVSRKTFSNQHFLIYLDLSSNKMEYIFPYLFQNNKKISHLLVQNNFITTLGTSAFVGLDSLCVLNLSSNRIDTIEPGSFKFIKKINVLDMSFNYLAMIFRNSFDDIDLLYNLNLTGNSLLQTQISNFATHILLDSSGFCCVLDIKHCGATGQNSSILCRTLFKVPSAKILLWVLSSTGTVFNIISFVFFVSSKSKSILTSLHGTCVSCNILTCTSLVVLLISDSYFGLEYSHYHKIWKEQMICFFIGVTFIYSRQIYLHSCFGQILSNFYIVTATHILKPRQRAFSMHWYLLSGVVLYFVLSITLHVFVKNTSDFCLSLAFNSEADAVAKVCILAAFTLNFILEILMIWCVVRIGVVVKSVESKVGKTRKKRWIAKLCMIITLNCSFGLLSEGFALGVAFKMLSMPDWILIALSVFPVVLYPGLMR